MMGHICTLLMGMVEHHHGEEGIDRIFELSGVARQRFRTEVLYPEELFQALLRASMELYKAPRSTLRWDKVKVMIDTLVKILPKCDMSQEMPVISAVNQKAPGPYRACRYTAKGFLVNHPVLYPQPQTKEVNPMKKLAYAALGSLVKSVVLSTGSPALNARWRNRR